MSDYNAVNAATNFIKDKSDQFSPKIGIILGSGLGGLVNDIKVTTTISYKIIPGFPISTIAGHEGKLILGELSGVPVACLSGRVHFYEGVSNDKLKILIRTLHCLGCSKLIITNAAGSLHKEIKPGEISLISDHINFSKNPMIGSNDDEFGPRFFPMTNAYDKEMREIFKKTAVALNINVHEGVYLNVTGPSFETPAEIKAFRTLGADLVGMSTVPEVIIARHCGMKLIAISAVTNLAAGLHNEELSHNVTLQGAKLASEKLCLSIKGFLENINNENVTTQ